MGKGAQRPCIAVTKGGEHGITRGTENVNHVLYHLCDCAGYP